MKKTLILALAATSLTAGGVAYAQETQRGADMTRSAAETRAATQFARMDANSDGVLNAADREARMRARFDAQDADGNGQLSFEEVQASREARGEAREERRAERGTEGRGGHRMGRRGMRGGGEMHGMMMDRADTDGDGAISQAEFNAGALARFERMDADSNGTVTAEERQAQRGERRGRHRGQTAE